MALLFVVTGFYTRSFNRESSDRGRQHYASAQALAALADYEQAAEHYRDALLYSRDNSEYRLGLALALFESERYIEAQNHLMELRPDDPTSGIVNRLLAPPRGRRRADRRGCHLLQNGDLRSMGRRCRASAIAFATRTG